MDTLTFNSAIQNNQNHIARQVQAKETIQRAKLNHWKRCYQVLKCRPQNFTHMVISSVDILLGNYLSMGTVKNLGCNDSGTDYNEIQKYLIVRAVS